MTKARAFEYSQKFEFVPQPESERLLIPQQAWDDLKRRVQNIKEAVNLHLTAASVLLGGFLSTFGLVLFGAIPRLTADGQLSVSYLLAWSLSAILLICGLVVLYAGRRHRIVQGVEAQQIVDNMIFIEQICQRLKGTR